VPVGYSKRSLADKLGVKPGMRLIVLGAPAEYAALLEPLPARASVVKRLAAGAPFVHQFVRQRAQLESEFPRSVEALAPNGMLWISWPKRASGVPTDLTEDVIRELGLAHGVVDVKVCAVDETWSGLKFVRRLADRSLGPKPAASRP
jgi:hypothetical protein